MSSNRLHVFPYPSEKVYNHPSINYILKHYFPTLKNKVEGVLSVKTKNINTNYLYWYEYQSQKQDFNQLNNVKSSLKFNLWVLKYLLDGKKPIVFISDSCFTNDLFKKELEEILEDDFDKFIDLVDISYTDESKNTHIEDKLYENSIVILWWSYSDLEDVPESLFEWELANFIKDVHNNKINSKLIWICWWQQLISSIIWFDEYFSERITTTYRWVAQFWEMPWTLTTDLWNIPYIYKNIVSSITNNWKNHHISYPLTRTWHIDFNLLNSYKLNSASTLVFIKDDITWSPIVWWTRNWNILWNQAHFEINYDRDRYVYEEQLNFLIPILQQTYGKDIENILLNIPKNPQNNYAWAFYSNALLSFTDSIIKKRDFNRKSSTEQNHKIESIKQNEIRKLVSIQNFWNSIDNEKLLENLDKSWFLRLSTLFDWKVNRWIIDVSDILWLDLEWFLNFHKWNSNWKYVFRDWWAWNWKLVNDIIEKTGINSYWVSDFWYFDIYEALVKLDIFSDVPKNILKIFVQELIWYYKEIKEWTVNEKMNICIDKLTLKSTKYKVSSMFTEKTYRFNDNEAEITDEDKQFLLQNNYRIEELKTYVKENLYDMIIWYFENIIFSDFNSLYIPESTIKHIDFQVAIRSTCHVDWKDLEKILEDYTNIYSKPWSVYIDNWLVRSDSWVPRIKEYLELEENHEDVKVYFTYDINTSYITSAIILKEPFVSDKDIQKYLKDWYILLTTDEIKQCNFFKIERFFRELMIFTFKDLQFNHDKNKEIISFLRELSFSMQNLSIEQLRDIIILKINKLVNDINHEYNEQYLYINEKDFDFYVSKVNEDIKDFFIKWDTSNPEWFNNNFERKN